MSNEFSIPAEIQRFILTSIQSVPHLEAALLLHYDPKVEWDAKMMAQSLYISEKKGREILADLSVAGFAVATLETVPRYHYSPVTPELHKMMDGLVQIYAKNLIEVTNLIHSQVGKQAQQFGNAFKWWRKKE